MGVFGSLAGYSLGGVFPESESSRHVRNVYYSQLNVAASLSARQLQCDRDAADREARIAKIARHLEARGCPPEFARQCAEYEADHD